MVNEGLTFEDEQMFTDWLWNQRPMLICVRMNCTNMQYIISQNNCINNQRIGTIIYIMSFNITQIRAKYILFQRQQFYNMATQQSPQLANSQVKKKTNATYTKAYSSSYTKSTVVYKPNFRQQHVIAQEHADPEKIIKVEAKNEAEQRKPQELEKKQAINNIVDSRIEIEDSMNREQRVLKQFSKEVKSSIKRNQDLTVHNHTQDIFVLKKQNEKLQAIINDYKGRSLSLHQSLLNEQNKYLKDYIGKGNSKKEQQFKKPQIRQQPSNAGESSIASLKKYIMTYINTVIERNDDKITAQQKQIEQLQTRIRKLNKLEGHLQHLQFQKTVKLQQSSRKSKNVTVGIIKNNGDRVDYEVEDQQQPIVQRKMFKNPYKLQLEGQSKELSEQNAQLYKSLCNLQEKYELQRQSHLNELAQREELFNNLGRLNDQNKHLKHSIFDLGERLKFSQQKQNELETYVFNKKLRLSGKIEPNVGFSLKKELIQLKNELKISGADKYSNIERQIVSIIIDRNFLRKQLTDLQDFIQGGSKLSATHRQVFHLREKNHLLQQKCKQLEQKIVQYQANARMGDQVVKLNKDIPLQAQEECLKWTRHMYFSIMSSINKLENIEAQMQVVSTI